MNILTNHRCFQDRTHQQETALDSFEKDTISLSQLAHSHKEKGVQHCILRALNDSCPLDFLPVVQACLPEAYELFLKVVEDRGYWEAFQEKSAEAFCKEGKTSSLRNIPSFPFCYMHTARNNPYLPHPQRRIASKLSFYTLNDLLLIAEQIVVAAS